MKGSLPPNTQSSYKPCVCPILIYSILNINSQNFIKLSSKKVILQNTAVYTLAIRSREVDHVLLCMTVAHYTFYCAYDINKLQPTRSNKYNLNKLNQPTSQRASQQNPIASEHSQSDWQRNYLANPFKSHRWLL